MINVSNPIHHHTNDKHVLFGQGDDDIRVPQELTGWFRKSRGEEGKNKGGKEKRFFILSQIFIKYYAKEPTFSSARKYTLSFQSSLLLQ